MTLLLAVAISSLGSAQQRTPASTPAEAASPTIWEAAIVYDSLTIPFPLELDVGTTSVRAALFNGDERVASTSGVRRGDSLIVAFEHLASELRVRVTRESLTGTFGPASGKGVRQVSARPRTPAPEPPTADAPDISGTWLIPAKGNKGESTWRFVVRQSGQRIVATILRVDGDAGAHVGSWQNGRLVLNHFDGTRPSQFEVTPGTDGSLSIVVNTPRGRGEPVLALRPDAALAAGLSHPADFATHTRPKNPDEVFRFSYPDLDGRIVSNTDARFANKVVIVAIGGTWCPNCHDEAPFLAALYKRYRARGVEIVSLDFEDPSQLETLDRPRAFVKKYGIDYPFLVAGATSELQTKVTQAENLDSWPTTFFLGRDGRVRAIHAGFAGPASGVFHTQLIAEYDETIERLLAEALPAR